MFASPPSPLFALGLLAALVSAPVAAAESELLHTDHLRSRLVAASDAAVPGQTLKLGLLLQHDKGWHTYWKNPGDSGLPTRMEFGLHEGLVVGEIEWPLPERQPAGGLVNFGYSHTELLPVSVALPADFASQAIAITLKASWLICELECIPGSGEYRLELPVAKTAGPSAHAAAFARAAERQAQVVDVDAR
ncbi:MAG: protein-disulfide reductase DsbD domain-containing protein, partial [Aquimonas sp.]